MISLLSFTYHQDVSRVLYWTVVRIDLIEEGLTVLGTECVKRLRRMRIWIWIFVLFFEVLFDFTFRTILTLQLQLQLQIQFASSF